MIIKIALSLLQAAVWREKCPVNPETSAYSEVGFVTARQIVAMAQMRLIGETAKVIMKNVIAVR